MVDKAGNTKLFDGSGRLTEIRSNTSNDRITLAYNGTLLSTITDGSGQVITITRNAENKVTAITDPYGRAVIWSYSDEKTMRLTYPDTKTIQFNYDNNRLSQITQRDGAKIKFTYPITGLTSHINRVSELRELSTSNSVGSIFAFDYSQGNATRITDSEGGKYE